MSSACWLGAETSSELAPRCYDDASLWTGLYGINVDAIGADPKSLHVATIHPLDFDHRPFLPILVEWLRLGRFSRGRSWLASAVASAAPRPARRSPPTS